MAASAVRRRRSALAAGVATLAMTLSLSTPAQAVDKYDYYVALGDSYAAGVGAGPYVDTACSRSDNAYAELADALKTVKVATNVACSGKTTQEVVSTQLGPLDRKTNLVTITAGGNNLGFGTITGSCLTAISDATNVVAAQMCTDSVTTAYVLIGDGKGSLYGDVKDMIQKVQVEAPNAKIVVTGYPYLFDPLTSLPTDPMSAFIAQAKDLADGLNLSIANAAADTGADYVDVTTVFAGHGALAAPADRWINFVGDPDALLHPNAKGYEAYLAALSDAGAYTP
jgi:lysophospholipase L1-like esterase